MSPALFDILTGRADAADPRGALSLSLQDHLQRLLNARRGSLAHLPGYGMPDVAKLYEALPYSLEPLKAALRQCIEVYEPRLGQLQVRQAVAPGPGVGRLQFEVSGRTACGQLLRYLVCFFSGGNAQVALLSGEAAYA
ncbi:hypothetical protein DESUT3_00900 [Desulfuromonas versatilis]|uniref:IraD/Gp25-like domain-containing protein n=1 Tax=Desulfuromonas versatilis TaxID=2802975 RepID=A0ABN6DSL6_9BACT|nr:type VI secretion system baseplate subunit TssE [Desulfuromonas versatilis]BCR03021.1 hypothetical protein DESUT3_00900 [Desulfuromonas versatilis]